MLEQALEELRNAAVAAEIAARRQEQEEIDALCAEKDLQLQAAVCSKEDDRSPRTMPTPVKPCLHSFLGTIVTL